MFLILIFLQQSSIGCFRVNSIMTLSMITIEFFRRVHAICSPQWCVRFYFSVLSLPRQDWTKWYKSRQIGHIFVQDDRIIADVERMTVHFCINLPLGSFIYTYDMLKMSYRVNNFILFMWKQHSWKMVNSFSIRKIICINLMFDSDISQNGLRSCSLTTHISVLSLLLFFTLYLPSLTMGHPQVDNMRRGKISLARMTSHRAIPKILGDRVHRLQWVVLYLVPSIKYILYSLKWMKQLFIRLFSQKW